MFRAGFTDNDVFRGAMQLALAKLQKFALVVCKIDRIDNLLYTREMKFVQNRTDFIKATIEIDRTKYGLVGVCQNAFLTATAHLGLGLPYFYVLVQRPFLGRLGAGMPGHDGAFAFGEFALRVIRICLVQVFRREHVQHGIAEEFQAFVVVRIWHVFTDDERAVDKRMSQQLRITEPIPKLSLKPVTGLLAKPEF